MTQWGLDTLFNPAKRHMDEEKQRLQSTREQVGDNSGGKRIDLESGKVRIERADTDDPDDDLDGAVDGADAGDSGSAGAGAQGADTDAGAADSSRAPKPELTPAQIRAAKRRGRSV